jgi:tetratricopeptide (TPR) repeat protein
MEAEEIPPHLSAEEHALHKVEAELLKDGGEWLKRAADLYTRTPKIKIWVPVACSMLLTTYYLYSMHAQSVAANQTPVSSGPPVAVAVVDDGPAPKAKSTASGASVAAPEQVDAPPEDATDADLVQRAQQAHGSQQFEFEAKLLQKVLDRSHSAVTVCPEIGKAYERAGQIDQAVRAFQQCVSMVPDNLDVQVAFAHTLQAKSDFRRASAIYRDCVTKDPGNLDAQAGLALVELRQNHLHEADESAQAILHKSPDNTDALLISGIVAWRQARLNDAERIFSRGAELDDHRPDFHSFLGRIAEAQRNPQLALQHYDKALELDPNDSELADRRDRLRDTK